MKKIILIIASLYMFWGCGMLYSQQSYNQYATFIDGYWGPWKSYFSSSVRYAGGPASFTAYDIRNHPSDFCYRINYWGFNKNDIKTNQWTTYEGTIEFYAYNGNSDIDASRSFVKSGLSYLESSFGVLNKLFKREATIKVKKEHGLYLYNIYFDGVGFAVAIPWKI